jgi:hypothetical protein
MASGRFSTFRPAAFFEPAFTARERIEHKEGQWLEVIALRLLLRSLRSSAVKGKPIHRASQSFAFRQAAIFHIRHEVVHAWRHNEA